MENTKTIDADLPSEQENMEVRLDYHSPVLEEQGNLHELTHGLGTVDDDGGNPGYLNFG